jgi:hypothetical protein
MSLGGYDAPGVDDEDYMMWVDATNYCRAKGTAIIAFCRQRARANQRVEHDGRRCPVVRSRPGRQHGRRHHHHHPGDTVANNDLRGLLENSSGVPGVIMVSATNNANGSPSAPAVLAHLSSKPVEGATDQLAYYSELRRAHRHRRPGGARKMGIPRYDVGTTKMCCTAVGRARRADGEWRDLPGPVVATFLTFSCFKVTGSAFGWLQGTSMSAAERNWCGCADSGTTPDPQPGCAAHQLAIDGSDQHGQRHRPNDPTDFGPSATSGPCTSGYCHLDYYAPGMRPTRSHSPTPTAPAWSTPRPPPADALI